MSVDWTPHRFSGGVLALDVTNTIVLRNDPARRLDRFDDASEMARFAAVAALERAGELGGRKLSVGSADKIHGDVIRLRGATDDVLRSMASTGEVGSKALGELFSVCSDAMGSHDLRIDRELGIADPTSAIPLEAAISVSALSLLAPARMARVRICANCDWLFLDSSRNGSRIWCDMAVCGNRRKARRHYDRVRKSEARQ